MGDLGEGQTDTLDERMWGDDDDDDDDEDGSDKEEESGQGMDQVQTTQQGQAICGKSLKKILILAFYMF